MPTIDLVYFNAGGGHRSAASALETVIREQGRPWNVRRINLMEVLDPKDIFGKTMGMKPEDLYNTRLARGWSLGLAQELKFLQALIRLAHPAMTARLRRYWRRTKPDMVVSLIPNFNRAMYEGLAGARPGAPYVTILTDFADLPSHFWIEPGQAQHFICGTRKVSYEICVEPNSARSASQGGAASMGGMSHAFAVWSLEVTSSDEPAGLKIAIVTSSPARNGRVRGFPVEASQTRAV